MAIKEAVLKSLTEVVHFSFDIGCDPFDLGCAQSEISFKALPEFTVFHKNSIFIISIILSKSA